MLPLEDFISTCYETAARIKIMSPKCDLLEFVVFAYEIPLKSPPANETTLLNLAWERPNNDYFIGFIDSCDVDAKLMKQPYFLYMLKSSRAERRRAAADT